MSLFPRSSRQTDEESKTSRKAAGNSRVLFHLARLLSSSEEVRDYLFDLSLRFFIPPAWKASRMPPRQTTHQQLSEAFTIKPSMSCRGFLLTHKDHVAKGGNAPFSNMPTTGLQRNDLFIREPTIADNIPAHGRRIFGVGDQSQTFFSATACDVE